MSQRPTLDLENFLPYRLTLLASHVAVTFAKQHAQRFGISIPEWRVIATLGAAHRQTFDVECEIPELGMVERGIGGSRRAGEQAAAAAVLALLKARKT